MQLDEFYNASSKQEINYKPVNGGNTSVKVNSDLLIKALGLAYLK